LNLLCIDISSDISAFAARKRFQVSHDASEDGPETTSNLEKTPVVSEEGQSFNSGSILGSVVAIQKFGGGIGQELEEGSEEDGAEAETISNNHEEDEGLKEGITRYGDSSFQLSLARLTRSRRKSREAGHFHPSNQSWTHLTTVNLSKGNAERLNDGSLRVKIAPGEVRIIQRPK